MLNKFILYYTFQTFGITSLDPVGEEQLFLHLLMDKVEILEPEEEVVEAKTLHQGSLQTAEVETFQDYLGVMEEVPGICQAEMVEAEEVVTLAVELVLVEVMETLVEGLVVEVEDCQEAEEREVEDYQESVVV